MSSDQSGTHVTGIHQLEMVARDEIEPSTRGFSVRQRTRFGASKPKKRNAFSASRPNCPARPNPYRTETRNSERSRLSAHAGQRLARIATEPFPNHVKIVWPFGSLRADRVVDATVRRA